MANITKINKPAPPAGKLNTTSLFLIAMGGVIGSGLITLIGPSIGATGYSVWLAYFTAIVLGFFMIFPIMIASSTVRISGALYSLCGDMANPTFAGMMSYTYLLQVASNALFAIALRTYLGEIFPPLDTPLTALFFLTLFFVINLFGVDVFAKVASYMTWVLLAGLLLYIAYGIPRISQPIFDLSNANFMPGGSKGFWTAVFLLIYSTQGYYIAAFYGGEAKHATRDIPKAMLLCLCVLIVLYIGVTVVTVGVLPMEESANKTLTATALEIMPKGLAVIFILCGPIMALTTTLNANMNVTQFPIRQACRDGWMPKSFAAQNKYGASWKILLYEYLLAFVPISLNFSITMITNNIQLINTFINVFTIVAVWNMPKKYPTAWSRSKMHMPAPLFYLFMCIAIGINVAIFYKTISSFTLPIAIGNCVLLLAVIVLGILVTKHGNVIIETSLWADEGEAAAS